tara:strand:+ start:457 stop:627 length:171 start_codon:yes stop_codon:yes gene_type:complete
MGILNKQKLKAIEGLSKEDLEFVLTKLRSADYRGHEFEHFYKVWTLLTNHLKTIKR